jgi:integrase/recombinase XerC
MASDLAIIKKITTLAQKTSIPASQHPVLVYLSSLPSPRSQRVVLRDLEVIAEYMTKGTGNVLRMDWSQLRAQHTEAIRAHLLPLYSPATVRRMLSSLRGVLKKSWRLQQMDAEDYSRAVDLDPVRGESLPKGRALSHGELAALFEACRIDRSPLGRRDAALLAVLFGGGLRRSEVVLLDVDDVDLDAHMLRVFGKGRKGRQVFLPDDACRAIRDWLAVRGEVSGPLFIRIGKGSKLSPDRLTDQSVLFILDRRRQEAKVKSFSPHDARRTFISTLWAAGIDGVSIQKQAGHARIDTSAKYDRRSDEGQKRAADVIHIPYTE